MTIATSIRPTPWNPILLLFMCRLGAGGEAERSIWLAEIISGDSDFRRISKFLQLRGGKLKQCKANGPHLAVE